LSISGRLEVSVHLNQLANFEKNKVPQTLALGLLYMLVMVINFFLFFWQMVGFLVADHKYSNN